MADHFTVYNAIVDDVATQVAFTIQRENTRINTTSNAPLLRALHIPLETIRETVGPKGYDKYTGQVLFEIYVPSSSGYTVVSNIVNTILNTVVVNKRYADTLITKSYHQRRQSTIDNYYTTLVVIQYEFYNQGAL